MVAILEASKETPRKATACSPPGSKPDQAGAFRPEIFGEPVAARRGIGLGDSPADHIGTMKWGRVARGREKQRGRRAFLWADQKRPDEAPAEPGDAAGTVADRGRDDAGMEAGGGDLAGIETVRQGAGEQDVAQL